MTPNEILLVRQGFDRLVPRAEAVRFVIYGPIFELDPSARALFREDMRTRVRHFMGAAELGDTFTPEARAAWQYAYEILAEAMVAALQSAVSLAHQSRRHVSRFTATTGVSA
jgi:hypothetical protein